MRDDQFLNYCRYHYVGNVETTNMIRETQPYTSSYIPLNIPLTKFNQKFQPNFLDIELLLDTGAVICILNTQTWNATMTYHLPSRKELKQEVDATLGTAKNQLLPSEGKVKLTLLSFGAHDAKLTITFRIADTKHTNFGLLILQTDCKAIDIERS